jgi:hypothetical protein
VTAAGISDTALVNIGGEIRREGYGRTIAGGRRLGRFISLKGEGEIRGILDAATKAQLNQYILDRLAEGYSRVNQNTLEKDMGGGVKQVINIDWGTGALSSSTGPTTEALKAQEAYERSVKRAKGFVESESLRAVLGEEGYYRNLAGQTKDPVRKQEYLALADKAAGRVLQQKVATGELGTYLVGGQLMSMAPSIAEKTDTGKVFVDISGNITKAITTSTPAKSSKGKKSASVLGYTSGGSPITSTSPVIPGYTGVSKITTPVKIPTTSYKSYMDVGSSINKIFGLTGTTKAPVKDMGSKSRVVNPLKHFLRRRRW